MTTQTLKPQHQTSIPAGVPGTKLRLQQFAKQIHAKVKPTEYSCRNCRVVWNFEFDPDAAQCAACGGVDVVITGVSEK